MTERVIDSARFAWRGSTLSVMPAAWDDAERAALVALLKTRPDGLTWPLIASRVAEAGSALAVWSEFDQVDLLGGQPEREFSMRNAQADIAGWRQAPYSFSTFMDPEYPARLREVLQLPPVIFTRGLMIQDDLGVSVVGSRKASGRGIAFAHELAAGLAAEGITVISGLAAGIDTAAHTAALAAKGRTVAVVGTGIERCYPAANAALQERISKAGAVISQFWPAAPPTQQSFPMRNALMSAYGRATIVVEAGEKSGARIQARLAVEHGRPVIMTSAVANGTTWGSRLIGAPGVMIAQRPADAIAFVHTLIADEQRVDRLLALAGE